MTQLQIGDGDGANEDMPIGLMRRTGTMRRTWSTRRTGPTRCKLRRMNVVGKKDEGRFGCWVVEDLEGGTYIGTLCKLSVQKIHMIDKRYFICEICGKVFTPASNLSKHIVTTVGRNHLLAPICVLILFTVQSVIPHKRNAHVHNV